MMADSTFLIHVYTLTSSANNLKVTSSLTEHVILHVININDKQHGPQNTALWHTTYNITCMRQCATHSNHLPPVSQKPLYPIQ